MEQRSRWADIAGDDAGERYAARFARLAESGADTHGEARLCAGLLPPGARVLDAGCGTGRVAIRLAELGYDCVGVDLDASMLEVARRTAPELPWILADISDISDISDLGDLSDFGGSADPAERVVSGERRGQGERFDMVVAAGNVIPLLAHGTEARTVAGLAALLRPGGLLVSGFGLDTAHLPLASATVTLADYDTWCQASGLAPLRRLATWDGAPYDGGGYAVSVHIRTPGGRAFEE
ncbi:methyltransferase domain-containing protein [Streptosporangium sp. NBC_01755]|uniref:class I SAM-dependent methyltransferase n=1 Tax=unclassified Streptosporangium TaxID=2632669 RepID=UPI002DDB3FCC|nr:MULTISPECIES: methyltransferase domain-containing protein [unclassified Streptosporangium]WSA27946.1 methyltransferase domain-containing protein [Streptosporangium sp. NBC_01810]WSD00583.1 methyltransferase domain-containing protein [Streptosporangium sp. NBC_01755]